jgi:hypothetical protein
MNKLAEKHNQTFIYKHYTIDKTTNKKVYKENDETKINVLISKLKENGKKQTIAVIQDYFVRFRNIDDAISNFEELC